MFNVSKLLRWCVDFFKFFNHMHINPRHPRPSPPPMSPRPLKPLRSPKPPKILSLPSIQSILSLPSLQGLPGITGLTGLTGLICLLVLLASYVHWFPRLSVHSFTMPICPWPSKTTINIAQEFLYVNLYWPTKIKNAYLKTITTLTHVLCIFIPAT